MKSDKPPESSLEQILGRVLDLSFQVSSYSPPMKPFIRFAKEMDGIYRSIESKNRRLFWNFDDVLQRILLDIIKNISTPQQLAHSCIERWKLNLDPLYNITKSKLEDLIKSGRPFEANYSKRENFIFDQVRAGSRFLYVGCGAGSDCLRFANRGYEVFGIDILFKLVNLANEWVKYLALPFKPICMDIMDLGFIQETFDFFLIEFYGSQTLAESLIIQRELARVLRKGGKGFMVGFRKQYPSFWYMMGSRYPTAMISWLRNQSFLDYSKKESDGNEEKLMYGLYYRSQTIDSMSAELNKSFNVLKCFYEEYDPRYVMCVVEPKENYNDLDLTKVKLDWAEPLANHRKLGLDSINSLLQQIESICAFLEGHEKSVVHFFQADHPPGKSPLKDIPLDIRKFTGLLETLYKEHPVLAAPED